MGAQGGTQGSASPIGYGTSGSFASYLSGYGLRVPAIAGITQPLLVPGSWLDFIAEDYGFNVGRWVYAREHYTGEVAAPWRVAAYLIRKKVGETIEAFEERVLLADYTPYFGAVVDTLAGMLIAREDETDRKWGKQQIAVVSKKPAAAPEGAPAPPKMRTKWSAEQGPLGDVNNPDTILGRLWIDADGQHNSWLTLWQLLATELTTVHTAWILVDGGADGQSPKVKLVQPESVQNWRYDENGVLVEALMKEHTDVRGSIQENPREGYETQWVYFDVNGWSRWHKVQKENTAAKGSEDPKTVEVPEEINSGTYAYKTRDNHPTIPLYQVRLPLKRNVGYLMARKCNAIFNKESERDHLLRFATFPLLNIVAEDAMFKRIEDRLRLGSRVLQAKASTAGGGGAHHFIAPESGPAEAMSKAIAEKVESFYATAFREFASSVASSGRDRVTATEVLAQREVGLEAYLAVLANAIDNAENATMYLLEQTVFPRDKTKWGQARCERPKTFGPINPAQAIEALKARYVGQGTLPGGRTATIDAIKRIMDHDGVEYDESEISEALDASALNQMAQVITVLTPMMPDDLKAEMIAQWGEANGYGKHDDLLAKAKTALQKAADQAKASAQNAMQPKPFGGGGGGAAGGKAAAADAGVAG